MLLQISNKYDTLCQIKALMGILLLIYFDSDEWGITYKQSSFYFHPLIQLHFPSLRCKHLITTSRFPFSSLWSLELWQSWKIYGANSKELKGLDNTGLHLQRMCANNTKKSRLPTTWDEEKDWCVWTVNANTMNSVVCERENRVRVRSLQ